MLSHLRSVSYFPIVKWKTGERRALYTLRAPLRRRLIPIFLMPPSGDFDHEEQRTLKPREIINRFGKRLYTAWGRSLVFVDAIGIDDDDQRGDLTVHPLTALLGRAHEAGALACPATTLDAPPEYQEAVLRFVTYQTHLPVCIRVTPLSMESSNFAADLRALLARLGLSPKQVLLVLDFASMGSLKPHEVEPFAEGLEDRIYNLPSSFEWLKIVAAFTSFPTPLKMKPNEIKLFPRTDWQTYRCLIEREPDLIARVAFGDYAIDPAPFRKPKRIIPSAHMRYTTKSDYLIVKGTQAKKPIGYGAIYPVADTLVARAEYLGMAFSEGDTFVSRLSTRDPEITTGNASTWRWAGTDHHFAQVLNDLRLLAGDNEDASTGVDFGVQISLF